MCCRVLTSSARTSSSSRSMMPFTGAWSLSATLASICVHMAHPTSWVWASLVNFTSSRQRYVPLTTITCSTHAQGIAGVYSCICPTRPNMTDQGIRNSKLWINQGAVGGSNTGLGGPQNTNQLGLDQTGPPSGAGSATTGVSGVELNLYMS